MAQSDLKKSKDLIERGELDGAWDIVDAALTDNPSDPLALMQATVIQEKARRYTIAYQFAERGVRIAPQLPEMWINLGRQSDLLYRLADAEKCYAKAAELATKPAQRGLLLMNLSGLLITQGRWKEAEEAAEKALSINPGSWKARGNLGMARLAQRNWSGWKDYDCIIGSAERKRIQYQDEPEWDGTKGKRLAIYGEQGLGDEISFASMIPDAISDSKKVVIDCDKRLEGLFKRSFPEASVYGTRYAKAGDEQWKPEDSELDASITMGGLGKFYRRRDADFPGTAYLKSDPDRVTMWKALFRAQGKPAIGVAWTGGMPWTASKYRKWDLAGLLPLFASVNAHWVSLQYKDAQDEINDFHEKQEAARIFQYPFGTLTKDYDDTAALVQSLDLVITMQTAVAHLAGALGKECWVFVPTLSQWRYGTEGDSIPWYKSVKVFRQGKDGSWPLGDAKRILQLRYGNLKVAA